MRPVKATLLGSAEDSAVQQRGVPSRRTGPRAPAVGGCVKSRPQSQHGRGSVVSPTAHLKGRLEGFREQYNGQL